MSRPRALKNHRLSVIKSLQRPSKIKDTEPSINHVYKSETGSGTILGVKPMNIDKKIKQTKEQQSDQVKVCDQQNQAQDIEKEQIKIGKRC